MPAAPHPVLAEAVLLLHVAVITFNVVGLVVIPLGAWLGWRFVGRPIWRLAHLASLAVVALQALAGRACFLTLAQDQWTGAPERTPMFMKIVNRIIYWPLPFWVFETLYLAVFLYVVGLLWWAPIGREPNVGSPAKIHKRGKLAAARNDPPSP